jgi:Rps23 Pro-64 3,4-dihydroxylase Tpa1-like proline 4-hydroxylase
MSIGFFEPMPWLDFSRLLDLELAAAWRAAAPFPHLILDDLVPSERRAELLDAFGEEPCTRLHDEIFELLASAKDVEHPALRAFQDDLGGPSVCAALARITGESVARVEMRAYAFEAGDYLLPHSDHQRGVGRALAFAYYLDTPFPVEGGELELFACDLDGDGAVIATRSARRIPPTPNRIVIFDVGDASLHQVREVTRGSRFSLSGWFYP